MRYDLTTYCCLATVAKKKWIKIGSITWSYDRTFDAKRGIFESICRKKTDYSDVGDTGLLEEAFNTVTLSTCWWQNQYIADFFNQPSPSPVTMIIIVWNLSKVGRVFVMVIVSILPHAEFGPNNHLEDTPHFW